MSSRVLLTTAKKEYNTNISDAFCSIRNLPDDVVFISAENEQIKTNRTLLNLYSPTMRSLLAASVAPYNIILPDASFKSIKNLLSIITKGFTNDRFGLDDVIDIVDTGELLGVTVTNLKRDISDSDFNNRDGYTKDERDNLKITTKFNIKEDYNARKDEDGTINIEDDNEGNILTKEFVTNDFNHSVSNYTNDYERKTNELTEDIINGITYTSDNTDVSVNDQDAIQSKDKMGVFSLSNKIEEACKDMYSHPYGKVNMNEEENNDDMNFNVFGCNENIDKDDIYISNLVEKKNSNNNQEFNKIEFEESVPNIKEISNKRRRFESDIGDAEIIDIDEIDDDVNGTHKSPRTKLEESFGYQAYFTKLGIQMTRNSKQYRESPLKKKGRHISNKDISNPDLTEDDNLDNLYDMENAKDPQFSLDPYPSLKKLPKCFKCDKIVSSLRHFKNHILSHYYDSFDTAVPSGNPSSCPSCGKTARDRTTTLRHFAFTHHKIFEYTDITPEQLKIN